MSAVHVERIEDIRRRLVHIARVAAFVLTPPVLAVMWVEARAGRLTPSLLTVLCVHLAYLGVVPFLGRLRRETAGRLTVAYIGVCTAAVQVHFGLLPGSTVIWLLYIVLAFLVLDRPSARLAALMGVLAIVGILAGQAGGLLPAPAADATDLSIPMNVFRTAATLVAGITVVGMTTSYAVGALETAFAQEVEAMEAGRVAEEARHRAERSAEASRQLELLGRLAGGVAHDLNNALTVVVANADLLDELVPDHPEARAVTQDLRATSESAARTTRELLGVGRQNLAQLEVVDPTTFLKGFVDAAGRLTPSHVRVDFGASDHVVAGVEVDPGLLRQALLNLTLNAVDAMGPTGGTIRFECHAEEGKSRLDVVDDGPGMDPDTLVRATEPFFTTKHDGKGTGLGLPMVRGFAEDAGGSMRIRSEPGRGTTVSLYLPQAVVRMDNELPDPAAEVDLTGLRLLIVDDEPVVRAYLSRTLRARGAHVTAAGTGAEALDAIGALGQLDLVVTDAILPGRPLSAILSAYRERFPTGRLLLCSAYIEEDLIRRDIRAGTVEFLAKPFTTGDLEDAVMRALCGPPVAALTLSDAAAEPEPVPHPARR